MYDEQTGKPVEPFDVAVDKLFVSENPNAKFGEFDATDLDGYIKAIDQKVQHLSVISRVPKHYLLPEGQEPSGDAIKSAESGLVKKVEKKHGRSARASRRSCASRAASTASPTRRSTAKSSGAPHRPSPRRTHRRRDQAVRGEADPVGGRAREARLHADADRPVQGHAAVRLLMRQLLEAGEKVALNISA
jgi:hypothetical protein